MRALLFSGHMIDAPGRAKPRFPPALEPAVAAAIAATLDGLGAGSSDVAITSAACGGDLLFAEAVLERGAQLRIFLPFDEARFLRESVAFAEDRWVERYRQVVARAELSLATDVLGALTKDEDPFERTNIWMLETAQQLSGGKVEFVCLWNGEGGDGPGGTQHMMKSVRDAGGEAHWIDIRKLYPG